MLSPEALQTQTLFNLLKDDFATFVEEIVGLNNEEFHNEIDGILSNYAYLKIAIAISRDHGKSTHLSVAYPLWEMAKNHNVRILLVSSTASTSMKFLSQILNHIQKNEKYKKWSQYINPNGIGVVPQMRNVGRHGEEKWSSEAITIQRDDLNLKDYTIQAVGLFGSILSGRADIIIVDDLVNQKNSETQEQREKVKDWFHTTLEPILVPGGRIVYLGNTWHQDDLIAELLKDPLVHYRKRIPAILGESKNRDLWNQWADIYLREDIDIVEKNKLGDEFYAVNKIAMDDGVKVLWPSRHSYGSLYLKRLRNSYSFSRMYQCDPSMNPNQRILEDWIQKAIEKGKNLRLQKAAREGLIMKDTTAGLDLAISQKDSADDTCLLTLDQVDIGNSEFRTGDFIIRDIERGHFTPAQTRTLVKDAYEGMHHTAIRVESVQYQDSMRRDIGDMGIPVTGHHTGGEKNDPDIGVNSLAILLELGKLIIPYDRTDARTIDLVSMLLNEMRSWPDGHTGDSLMALWFAYFEMREHKGRAFTAPRSQAEVMKDKFAGKSMEEINKELDLEAMRQANAMRGGIVPVKQAAPGTSSYPRKYSF